MSGQKPREIAAQVLQAHAAGQDYVENVLEKALARAALSAVDRRLCQELVYGAVRWQAALDWLIARKAGRHPQKPGLQVLLRLGLYQCFWLDRIPDHAAVNETVEQARRSGFGPQAGFVNAVLRAYLREDEGTKQLLADLKRTQPHLGHSHPEWLVARWLQRWGAETAAQLMQWNNTPPKTFARINLLQFAEANEPPTKTGGAPHSARAGASSQKSGARRATPPATNPGLRGPGDLLTQWRDEGVDYDFVRRDWFDENLVFELKSHPPLATLPSFHQGLFYVQDPSTLLAVRELNPQPGETILDLCAAPGGKATYIAQLLQNRGRIVAHDTAPERLKLLEENCSRLGATCVETVTAANPALRPAAFDRVLLDAPCSNTGVMRRRVDLRWRLRPEELERLRQAQLKLLKLAAPLLKPGGTLVYSTCSLEPEENREVVERFLTEQSGFELKGERELTPFKDEVDGAYVARWVRSANGASH